MDIYIGTKIVGAEPMSAPEFELAAGKELVKGISAPNTPGYKVVYEDGYVSWSPKDVFERSYRKVTIAEAGMIASAFLK